MGPSRGIQQGLMGGLQQLLQQLSTSKPTTDDYGAAVYDQPPNWALRKFPGHGMHPGIDRMQEAVKPSPADNAITQVLESLKDDPEKQSAFLDWYLRQKADSIPRGNPKGYF